MILNGYYQLTNGSVSICVLLVVSELNDTLSDNNDTVGQIVHYIMKNEGMCPTN